MNHNKNIAIIDIDGILADYRRGLLQWILTYPFPKPISPAFRRNVEYHLTREDTWINHETLEVSYRYWLEVLETFRMAGGKVDIPLMPGAKEFMDLCKYLELEIVLLTSRPIDIYHTIYRDTLQWLTKNRLPFNMVLWSKDKAEMIYKMGMVDKVLFTVDDQLSHVVPYAQLNINSFWLDLYEIDPDPSRSQEMRSKRIIRVHRLEEVTQKIKNHFSGVELL